MSKFKRTFSKTIWFILSLSFFMFIIGAVALFYLEMKLPDIETLENIQYQVPLKIYSSDGKLIAEYGEKRRIPIHIEDVPKPLIQGLLATEDQRFFEHPGVDLLGLGRAAVQLIRTGAKSQGGSTITMQVARNFFLDRKKTYIRKINEILLAIKIDHYFSKEKILELYLNKIYLGNRAYGIAAAAQTYYGKKLSQLTIPEMAMIAGLPQAPSAVNPISNPEAAKIRRNHVLSRMLEENFIDEETYQKAIRAPITAHYHGRRIELSAPYVAEFVRLQLTERLGNQAYTSGYKVYTTVSSEIQEAANKAVHDGLVAYDRRHGYRGPRTHISGGNQIPFQTLIRKLEELQSNEPIGTIAYITGFNGKNTEILLSNKLTAEIPWSQVSWARKQLSHGAVGSAPTSPQDVLSVGDVILTKKIKDQWTLYQIPEVEGALISLAPNDGSIRALVGGFSFRKSHFNRVVQAERQPGSSFKPFIYSTALEQGFTLATIINDAPIVQNDPSLDSVWRPQNDNRQFGGPTRLREGLIRSRNLVSIRVLDAIGIDKAIENLAKFGFNTEKFPHSLSLALGTVSLTPIELAKAYSVFANGGYLIDPYLIHEITDVYDQTIFKATPKMSQAENPEQQASQIVDKRVAYLMNDALQDVIQHGTGRRAKALGRKDLAGKTGTTNDKLDAWFSGYIPGQLVSIVWVGFDQPNSLYEYAAKAALPIWMDYMKAVLPIFPEQQLATPEGIVTIKIDPQTGLQAYPGEQTTVFEHFREENVPQTQLSDGKTAQESDGEQKEEVSSESHLF